MRNPVHSLTKRLVRRRRFPALARRRGAVFMLDPRNWIDNRLLAGAPFEDEQISHAAGLIREHRLETVIDAGANIGVYTILLGLLPEVERVVAFEPVRRNYNQLLANVFANRLDARVDAHRVALGDAPGEAAIHIDPSSTGVSRLDTADAARDRKVFSETETVAVVRLDDVVRLAGARVFMKIDVEGYALPALAGMERLFAENFVVVQAEALGGEADGIAGRLAEHGLRPAGAVGDDRYFVPTG